MYPHTVVVLRAGETTDRDRNQKRDWSTASRTAVTGVSVQPASRTEASGTGRPTLVSGWRLYTAPGVDVDLLATDRVELADGTVTEVVGEVARWPDPHTGGVHHVEVDLQRVRG